MLNPTKLFVVMDEATELTTQEKGDVSFGYCENVRACEEQRWSVLAKG